MKYFFDTEFIEDGRTIDFISIGIAAEDGRTFYRVSSEFNRSNADFWVQNNVLSQIPSWEFKQTRFEIAREILKFIGNDTPEFWAYYADYDWVSLCQLYGRMIDLPNGWPMFCRDVKQLQVEVGRPELPKQKSREHHALNDAIWCKEAFESLVETIREKGRKGECYLHAVNAVV